MTELSLRPKDPGGAIAYRPQLDGVRAIAVGLVLLCHFAPGYARWLPGGDVGVGIFFVLSGYLISGILLQIKQQLGDNEAVGSDIRQFYIRRVAPNLSCLFSWRRCRSSFRADDYRTNTMAGHIRH
jgi:peptidoglycan/LPS O-acetylase OafA/YrhL